MAAGGYNGKPPGARRDWRALRAIAAIALILLDGCAALHNVGLWSAPGIYSFDGVGFGDSYRDAELACPQAAPETSPYGAQSLRLDNAENDGIRYRTIILEFRYNAGMQLVMAGFDPAQTLAVRNWIEEQTGSASGSDSSSPGITTWKTVDGKTVILDNDSHWLAIVGPQGAGLRPDIKLVELNAASAS